MPFLDPCFQHGSRSLNFARQDTEDRDSLAGSTRKYSLNRAVIASSHRKHSARASVALFQSIMGNLEQLGG